MTRSQNGRRVLVAVATGEAGDRIREWRERYDPEQARRLPPHATLCYWAPDHADAELLEQQVRHAFDRPIAVRLGGVHEFDNADRTLYVEVSGTEDLNAARDRLYDGRFLNLEGRQDFTWHVTCVRYPDPDRRSELQEAAAQLTAQVATNPFWHIETVAWLELRDGVYRPIATWSI